MTLKIHHSGYWQIIHNENRTDSKSNNMLSAGKYLTAAAPVQGLANKLHCNVKYSVKARSKRIK